MLLGSAFVKTNKEMQDRTIRIGMFLLHGDKWVKESPWAPHQGETAAFVGWKWKLTLPAWLSPCQSSACRGGDDAVGDTPLFSPLFAVKRVIWNHRQMPDWERQGMPRRKVFERCWSQNSSLIFAQCYIFSSQ